MISGITSDRGQTVRSGFKLTLIAVLIFSLSGILMLIPEQKISAAPPYYGVSFDTNITNSAPNRNVCGGSNPVDFWAWISNPTLNEDTGDITYRVNLRWKSCNNTNTRAYSIYDTGSRETCVLSGDYGVNNSNAYDCAKYVGNPAYNNGNELTCSGGRTNAQCTNDNFGAIRVKQNQPPDSNTTDFVVIRKTISNWSNRKYSAGSSQVFGGGLCQYYKTGSPNWQTNHIGSRCMNVGITFSWTPNTASTVRPSASLSPNPVEPGQVIQANGSIIRSTGNMEAKVKYKRHVWYENDGNRQHDTAETFGQIVSEPPGHITAPVTLPTAGWSRTVANGYSYICTSLELYDAVAPTQISSNPSVDCAPIVRKTYIRVVAGDVNTTCSASPIDAFWNTTLNRGSGTDLALYTKGVVSGTLTNGLGFASAASRTAAPARPKGLTFANIGTQLYGQSLGAQVGSCVIETPPAGSPSSIPPLTTMPASSSLKDGVLYVDGDVSITDNIIYGDSFVFESVPYFKVVASGDIYIAARVTRIDGTYIAGKTIYTCTDNNGTKPISLVSAGCGSTGLPLIVNGALAANNIKFLRLNGSIGSNVPGELISYDPLVWLRDATPGGLGRVSAGEYDAYTIMPPIL